ncbi:MAG: hypothetical protein ACJAXI_002516 [Crocinitomicaceae bacterium]|jgi:hypothetical protein
MKKNKIKKIATLLIGGVGFNILFWSESLGVNLLLFSLFLIGIGVIFHRESVKSKPVLISASGILFTALMVVYHNSFMAKFTCMTSIVLFVGFLNQIELKAIFHAIPTSIWNLGMAPVGIWEHLIPSSKKEIINKKHLRTLKIVIIPILFFMLFYVIFLFSNPVFAKYSTHFWEAIGIWIQGVFENISLGWIFMFLLGLCFVGWVLFKFDLNYFLKIEQGRHQDITRAVIKKKRTNILFKNLDLKNEYRSALYLIVSINALLLLINVIDVSSLWFNFEYDESKNLSQFVHEGTYLLILSILLSIGILLYFYRKNLNFYFKKKTLNVLATIWIFQNLILVISVAVRNYHYIHNFGLAYKRIGVIIFLIATIVGLITLFIKISKRKSSYFLILVNSWHVYFLLIVMSFVNWDSIIINHNINHSNKINTDVEFLMSLSDKTLPVLVEKQDELNLNRYELQILDSRIYKFKRRKKYTSWKSWNYAEQKALEKLNILGL